MLTKVDVEVHEGRVLLAGRVPKRAQRVEAVRLAWQVDGVTQVINEIQVAEPEDVGDYMHDIWLAQELHAVLLVDIQGAGGELQCRLRRRDDLSDGCGPG